MTTESTVTVTYANTSQVLDDPSALTTVNYVEGCVADGGAQPPDPSLYGWQQFGSSPAAGKCKFSNLSSNGSATSEFQSGQCLISGQPWDIVLLLSWSNGVAPPVNVCTIPSYGLAPADSHFAMTNQLPTSVTISAPGLSTAHGSPQLLVYDRTGANVGTATAMSVASDGSSATFPFPLSSSGGALSSNFYFFGVKNWTSSNGDFKIVGGTYFDLGTTSGASGVFGLDAYDESFQLICTPSNSYCNHYWTGVGIVYTQYYANQLVGPTGTIPVGNQPVAVKTYGGATVVDWSGGGATQSHTIPSKAVVVNMGSNNVNVVNLVNNTVLATLPVGTQPTAVALNSAATYAYVVSFGSGTLSEINLTTLAVSRTLSVGSGAQAVTMDPGGSAVWVGGAGYLKKVDLGTFAVTVNSAVSGNVTSLAASKLQNELVYSSVSSGCCSGSSSYATQDVQISNMTSSGTYGSTSATPYASYTMEGTLPTPSLNPGATQVSTQWGNGMAASATPTGFVVYDVVSHREIMRGTTPTPVRSIATNSRNTVMYLSLPDSNEYVTVPLPQ